MKENVPFSQSARMLQPGPLALVTSQLKGQPNVMAAAWVFPLSLDPAIASVSLRPTRFTHQIISKSEEFVLNIPSLALLKQVHYCGSVSGRDVDKFKQSGLTPVTAKEVAAPLIEQCLAHVECGLINAITFGDHTLFVGQVLSVQVDREAYDGAWTLQEDEAKPLHSLGGRLYAVMHKRITA